MEIRQQFIVSKKETLKKLLAPLQGKGRIETTRLRNELHRVVRGGSFGNVLCDAKILELVKNGGQGVEITELGEKFLKATDAPLLQELGLKVHMFNEMFYQKIKDRPDVENFVRSRLASHYKGGSFNVYSNLAVLRYLEFLSPPIEQTHISEYAQKILDGIKSVTQETPSKLTADEFFELQDQLRALYKKYGGKSTVIKTATRTD